MAISELLNNVDKIHTTVLGEKRIKKNLSLDTEDVVDWCKKFVLDSRTKIKRTGKNFYACIDNIILTINGYSYTIITAHKTK